MEEEDKEGLGRSTSRRRRRRDKAIREGEGGQRGEGGEEGGTRQ